MDFPTYDPQSAVTPLTAEELGGLDRLLQNLPADAAMTLDGVDGYLTALLAAPPQWFATLPSATWLPPVWGGDTAEGNDVAAPFASKRQRKATVVLILRHLRHLSEQLHHDVEQWEPIFSVAEKGAQEWVDARDWCAGFLQAVDLAPDLWTPVWSDPILGPALAPLVQLGGGLEAGAEPSEELDDPQLCDAHSRAVPDAVLMLLQERTAQP